MPARRSANAIIKVFGAWLSLVERLVRDQEVQSSNLCAPTINGRNQIRAAHGFEFVVMSRDEIVTLRQFLDSA